MDWIIVATAAWGGFLLGCLFSAGWTVATR